MHAGLVEFLLGEVNRISGLQLDRDELRRDRAGAARARLLRAGARVRLDARRVRGAHGRPGAGLPRAARERRRRREPTAVTGSAGAAARVQRLSRLGLRTDRLGVAAVPAGAARRSARRPDRAAARRARARGGAGAARRLRLCDRRTPADRQAPAAAARPRRPQRSACGPPRPAPRSRAVRARRAPAAAAGRPVATPVAAAPPAAGPLARAARRVPGGAVAVVTPVAAAWRRRDPSCSRSARACSGPRLSAAFAQPVEVADGLRGRSRAAEPVERAALRPGVPDALTPRTDAPRAEPEAAAHLVAHVTAAQPVGADLAADHVDRDDASTFAGHGSGGLAELIHRWERAQGQDDVPPATGAAGGAGRGRRDRGGERAGGCGRTAARSRAAPQRHRGGRRMIGVGSTEPLENAGGGLPAPERA